MKCRQHMIYKHDVLIVCLSRPLIDIHVPYALIKLASDVLHFTDQAFH